MNRFLRILFPLIAVPTAIATLLIIALFTIFPQKELRRFASAQIGKSIHRQLEIGPVHLKWNGVTVDSLRVSEVPSFAASGLFFEARGVRMGWQLRSLWQGLDLRRRTITRSSGNFFVKEFRNPNYVANDFDVEWSLHDMDSTGSRLNGWAKLKQGTGALKEVEKLMAKSTSAKVALAPVMALLNLQRSGVINLGLPDLRHLPIDRIEGDYKFTNGLMTIKEFELVSPKMNAVTQGTVELATGKLALGLHLQVPNSLDAQLQIGGTTAHPQVDLTQLKKKAFQATLTNVLKNPEKLKSLFR